MWGPLLKQLNYWLATLKMWQPLLKKLNYRLTVLQCDDL